jgi:hypothetical protein
LICKHLADYFQPAQIVVVSRQPTFSGKQGPLLKVQNIVLHLETSWHHG